MKNVFSLYTDFVLYCAFFIASILYVGIMVSYFNKELYGFVGGNGLYLLVLIYFFIILFFSVLLFLYNVLKYSEIKFQKLIVMFLIPIPIVLIVNYIANNFFLDSYLITVLLKVLVMLFMCMFIMSIPLLFLSSLLLVEPNPLKRNFIRAKLKLDKLMKEPIPIKKLDDVYYIAEYYHDGIKEIKNSFGEVVYFNNIIDSSTKKSLSEILDHLTFSIPYYIFYGGIEQMKEIGKHLENINKSLGAIYSIEGGPFMIEILRMNANVDKYFKENSFKLSKIENTRVDRYGYYKKQIFLGMVTLVSSIILNKLVFK